MMCRHVCNRWALSVVSANNNEVYFVPIRDSGYIKKLLLIALTVRLFVGFWMNCSPAHLDEGSRFVFVFCFFVCVCVLLMKV